MIARQYEVLNEMGFYCILNTVTSFVKLDFNPVTCIMQEVEVLCKC
jgi:hypothetical protein